MSAVWDGMLDLLLPEGQGHIAVLQAYFDESERDCGVFAVSGYLFEAKAARAYALEARHVFGPYGGFHMTDLVARQAGFKGITGERRDELVKTAVDLVNQHMTAGVSVSCWTQDVQNFGPDFIVGFRHAYSICCHLAGTALGHWLQERWPGGSGGVSYVFESGHDFHAEAHRLITNVTRAGPNNPYLCRSHAFMEKTDAPPLWAADLLAWEWSKYMDETVSQRKRPMRMSLASLIGSAWDPALERNPKYKFAHVSGAPFLKFLTGIRDIGLSQLIEDERARQAAEAVDVKLPPAEGEVRAANGE